MTHFYDSWTHGHISPPPETPSFECSSCHMVRPPGSAVAGSLGLTRDLGPFLPQLKCCSFDPFLPSFTIGSPDFLETVSSHSLREYLHRRKLTPLGALDAWSPSQDVGWHSSIQFNSVCEAGRDPRKACAFLSKDENPSCTIHKFRPSPCLGYVCRSKEGAEGFRKWRHWEKEINRFEWTLAHLTAFELGYTLDDVAREFTPEADAFDFAVSFYKRAYEVAVGLKPWVG